MLSAPRFVSLALQRGYRLGFQSSSDHGSTHISYCNVWVEQPTPAGILAGMKARHIYGATDNIIADVRSTRRAWPAASWISFCASSPSSCPSFLSLA